MDILAALAKSKAKETNADIGLVSDYDRHERVMIDGLWSISDEVFEAELWQLGIDLDIISERLREPVETREQVILMYERGIR
jgi:hypothetical protein